MITFRDVYEDGVVGTPTVHLLYTLLSERAPSESISHKSMPAMPEHTQFVHSMPYREWFLICVDSEPVGAIYLSKANEVGVHVLRRFRRRGYGQEAIRQMVERHLDERLLANINPQNLRSIHIFKKLGFKQVQTTFEWVKP